MPTKHISDLSTAGALTGNEIVEISQLSTTVTITGTTISAAAADNSYNDSANGFVTAGFAVNDRVSVSGFTGNAANNIYVGVVTSVTAGKLIIGGTDGDVIVDDAAGESVTISKWTTRRSTLANLLASVLPLTGGTLTGDLVVPAEIYGAGWNGSNEVPTKNDVYDKIEALSGGIPGEYTDEMARDAIGTALQVGAGLTKTVDDGADTITIALEGVHTIPVNAAAMVARTTNGAAAGSAETATNKVMTKTYDFDQTTDEFVQVAVPMPKGWNEGTVTVQFIWTATTTGDVVWGAQALALSDDDALDTAFGTAQTVTDSVTAAGDLMQSAFTAAITVGGSPANEDVVWFQFYRDADNVSDTLAADAKLIGVRIKVTVAGDDS